MPSIVGWELTIVVAGVALLLGILLGVLVYLLFFGRRQIKQIKLSAKSDAERVQLAERKQLRSVYNMISMLTATLKYERVLDMTLDLASTALAAPGETVHRLVGAVLLFQSIEGGTTELRVASARGFTPADQRISVPGSHGAIGKAVEDGEPVLCKSILTDRELRRFIGLKACKAAYALPLRTGLDVYGVLLFAHPDEDYFTPDRCDILDIMGHQAVVAIQNARLYSDLEQEKERMMEIQEDARKKLARDLHDGPTQSVAAIAMRVNFTRRLMSRDLKAATEELAKIEDLARRTTQEIRHMLFTLRPLVLESQGLIAALNAMAEKMGETYDQNVKIEVDPQVVPELEVNKQTVIFYIAEEAVNNARKYAQATHIWVRLKMLANNLALLEIQDDGVGFNVGAVDASYENRGSLGMVNMRERTELVNGVIKIDSVVGCGTNIRVVIPLSEDAADRLRRGNS